MVAVVERCMLIIRELEKAREVDRYEDTRIAKRNVVCVLKEAVRIRKDEMFILPDELRQSSVPHSEENASTCMLDSSFEEVLNIE